MATDSLFPLPPNWIWTRIGDVGEVQIGKTRSRHSSEHMIPYLRAGNLTASGDWDLSDVQSMAFSGAERDKFSLAAGDILLAEASGSAAHVGRPALWDGRLNECCYQNHLIRFRVSAPLNNFALLVFKYYRRTGVFRSIAHGVGIQHLSAKRFAMLPFPLPPREALDELLETGQQRLQRLSAIARILETVGSRLRVLRDTVLETECLGGDDASHLPQEWSWTTVEANAKVSYGTSTRLSRSKKAVPVLRMGNIVNGELDVSDLRFLPMSHEEFPELLLKKGDGLFNRTNSPELVGKSAVFRGKPSPCSFASYLLRIRTTPTALAEIITNNLNSPRGRRWAASVLTQQAGQANINRTKLLTFTFPIPPVDQIPAITGRTRKRLRELDHVEHAVRQLAARILGAETAALEGVVRGDGTSATDGDASRYLQELTMTRPNSPRRQTRSVTAPSKDRPRQDSENLYSLISGKRPVRVEQLFRSAGFSISELHDVDVFYQRLAHEIREGLLREVRRGTTTWIERVQ